VLIIRDILQSYSTGEVTGKKDLKSFGHCGCAGSSPASSTSIPD